MIRGNMSAATRPNLKRIATRGAANRSAFTLVELAVAIGIIVVLIGLVAVAGSATYGWMRKSNARQQMALIAKAIDAYSDAWPRWKVGDVTIADKGWPDFIPGRLFPSIGSNAYNQIPGFNGDADYFAEDGISYSASDDGMTITEGDVEYGSECLYYALTSTSGGGPFITNEIMGELISTHDDEFYPVRPGQPDLSRGEFVDPWGVPYRYFWVYRDDEWSVPGGWTWPENLPKGFVAVDFGPFHNVFGYGTLNDAKFRQSSGRNKKAVAYVLESAGPDRRFGNIWQPNLLPIELQRAEDNLIVMP